MRTRTRHIEFGSRKLCARTYRAVETLGVPVLTQCLDPSVAGLNREVATMALGLEQGGPVCSKGEEKKYNDLSLFEFECEKICLFLKELK